MIAALVNGKPAEVISIHDRGLQFGDGVFETIAVQAGAPLCLDAHLARLQLGCQRLSIAGPEPELLEREARRLCATLAAGTLKLIVTRGAGGRGYQAPAGIPANRIMTLHRRPAYPESCYREGVRAFVCSRRLADSADLAGIKHLNRLEQVLLRREVDATPYPEGVALDRHGHVIEGSMSNLFMVKDGALLTPDLSRAGVAGVVRGAILRQRQATGVATVIRHITLAELRAADEVFCCNSVIGIWPLRSLGETVFNSIDTALDIMKKLTDDNVIAAV